MIRSMLFSVAVACAIFPALTLAGCGPSIDVPEATVAQSPATEPEGPATQNVRILNWAPNKASAELLSRVVTNPSDWKLREQLATTYRDADEPLLGDFFAATAVAARDHAARFPAKPVKGVLLCPEAPSDATNSLAESISSKIVAGRYQEAFEEADSARDTLAGSCVFHPQWASAAIWAYVDSPSGVSLEQQENAIRLLMVLAEAELYPRTATTRAAVYELIAAYFMAHGDGPSAYVALLTAKDRLESEIGRNNPGTVRALADLERRIAKARDYFVTKSN